MTIPSEKCAEGEYDDSFWNKLKEGVTIGLNAG